MIKNLQKIGGIAALVHTAALVVGMVLSFTLMFPLLDATPDQAQKFLSSNQYLMHLWNWIVDWGAAITLVVMLLALYVRLKPGAAALMQAAVVFGFLWAGLTIGTSNINLHNFGAVANLFGSVPAQVAAWTALARSLWVLLISLAALRTGELTRALGYLGVFLGIVGGFTLVPTLTEAMFMIFGPGMMAWSAWMGIIMLRCTALDTDKPARTRENWQTHQISNR